jgi:hypothetical protein
MFKAMARSPILTRSEEHCTATSIESVSSMGSRNPNGMAEASEAH